MIIEKMTIGQMSPHGNRQKDQTREAEVLGKVEDRILKKLLLLLIGAPSIPCHQVTVVPV